MSESGGMPKRPRSRELFEEAQRYLPGGVNSPVRAFKAVGTHPVFIAEGHGSRITDVDGNTYIDYVCSWGPLILGHAHPSVVEAVSEAAARGTSYGAPTEAETRLARMVVGRVPGIEKIRMVNSGTEATMSAVRLARAFTGRAKIVKFIGCYHGHADMFLIKAGSGALTLGVPNSPGVTKSAAEDTLLAAYNDLESVERLFAKWGKEIAAVIVEPVAANMGVVVPDRDFLVGLRELTRRHGALLIFDEVITGFRLAYGGAQEYFGIEADLACYGKIIGGGLPVGAYGGRRDIMAMVAPEGPVYQAGTLSGNPLAMAAGIATLEELSRPGVYDDLRAKTARLVDGLKAVAREAGAKVYTVQVESLFCSFFTEGPVRDFESAARSDTEAYARFFNAMLDRGVYLAPSQFEAGFVSVAHTDEDIAATVEAAREAFATHG